MLPLLVISRISHRLANQVWQPDVETCYERHHPAKGIEQHCHFWLLHGMIGPSCS